MFCLFYTGSTPPSAQQQFQEINTVQDNKHVSSDLVPAENTNLHCEDCIGDERAPTPAASRLNSDDYLT
ncbi:TPA: hypothetical protein GDO54_018422 [Pyxicephalus adspersus]|uniref:Uncharacterized protein n=1 Tax=Pyxicephalus adspersus TaxID=30357 RepID=A0AAV2ZNR6_PYXAD|nr:TPA: hypothetical protein GDO54_018422 [Pyxicephalus adspersus]